MARPTDDGLKYSPWSVDMFDVDDKIADLIDAQGWVGFGVYFYLCQRAYKTDGYFLRWSYAEAARTARRMAGGVGSQTVINTVNLCFKLGLFDRASFERHGVITSRGIQKRYLLVPGRRINPAISLIAENEKANGSVSCTQNADISPENGVLEPFEVPLHPQKRSKEKESESKQSEEERAPAWLPDTPTLIPVGEGWMQAMRDAGMETTTRAQRLVGQLAARYGDAEACTCIRIAAAQGRLGPDYVCGIARRRAEEGQTGKPYPPPRSTRPARHVAKHDYEQRTYSPDAFDALFYDVMADEPEGTGKKEGLT